MDKQYSRGLHLFGPVEGAGEIHQSIAART